jgi:signal transduction histidine kinase
MLTAGRLLRSSMSMPIAKPGGSPQPTLQFAMSGRAATMAAGVVVSIAAAAFLVTASSVPVRSSIVPWLLVVAALALTGAYVQLPHPQWRATLLLTGIGLCGAQFEHLLPSGPGFVIVFLTMLALGYQLPLGMALPGSAPAIALAGHAAWQHSLHASGAATSLAVGAVMLVVVASRSAVHLRSLEEAARRRAADDLAAAEAERTRIARELHDILTHTLSGVQLRLEGTRYLLGQTPAGGVGVEVAEQVDLAHQLALDGLVAARSAITSLRGDTMACPQMLPALVEEIRQSGLLRDVTLDVHGAPRPLANEVGQAVYRTVQESLTNVAKHVGSQARARVALKYQTHGVTVEIVDTGGGPRSQLRDLTHRPERVGYGLQGLAERAALLGGCLQAEPLPTGFRVRLALPTLPSPSTC